MDFNPGPMTIPKVKFGDLELLSTMETKFLGINLDNNLSWGHHFIILCNQRLLALSKNTLSIMAKLLIYYAHIYSHLTYTIVVWGSMLTDNKIEKLYKIQRECASYIANANKTTHTDPLFQKFKTIKMKDIKELELLKFGYEIDHKIRPQPILDLFKKMGKNYWN